MKKVLLSIAANALYAVAFAGGLLTNTNQNVHFLRNPARDASTEIDAVYSNPAGLSFLENDGLTLSLNNQSAFQTRTITSTFAPFAMNGGNATKEYAGEAQALFIPSLQAAYKLDKWVFSGSFAVVGGGGTATFDRGLPSFESQVAANIAAISNAAKIPTTYSLDSRLEGSQIIYGIQLGATYKINDYFSAFVGGRASIVKNGYEGYLRNVRIAEKDNLAAFFTTAAASARQVSSSLQPAIDGGFGSLPLNSIPTITPEQLNQMAAGLGKSPAELGEWTVAQTQSAFNTLAQQADGAKLGIDQLTALDMQVNC